MNKKIIVLINVGLGIGANTFAGTMGDSVAEVKSVTSLSIGSVWYKAGQTQTFFLQPEVAKTYSAYRENDVLGIVELFHGQQKPLNSHFIGQLGLAIAVASKATLSGDIWEDADPDFNNYYYNYKINHGHLAIKGKLLAEMGYMLTPYLSGSLGIGLNHSHDFTITPKLFEEVPAPPFTSHTQIALTYTLGAGLQKQLSENWSAGIGYEFGDWGKSRLSAAWGQSLNNGLQLDHFYTNQLQFNLSYLA